MSVVKTKDGVIDFMALISKDPTPYKYLSKQEKKEYQEKIKHATRGGNRMANLQINALDAMSRSLRQKKFDAKKEIEDSLAEIKQIEAEEAKINKLLAPVQSQLDAKVRRQEELREVMRQIRENVADLMSTTKQNINDINKTVSKWQSQKAAQELSHLRGYSMSQSHRIDKKKTTTAAASRNRLSRTRDLGATREIKQRKTSINKAQALIAKANAAAMAVPQ